MYESTTFADWMRNRRRALGLTQAALAEQVGCALVTIRKIEQQTRRPSPQLCALLADQLVIPAAQREAFLRLGRGEFLERMPPGPNFTTLPEFLLDAHDAHPSAFVAREEELATLDRHLLAAGKGTGRVVFISGEAGSGKTALMREFSRRSLDRHPDLLSICGRCTDYHGIGDPYLPFREIFDLLTGNIESHCKAGAFTKEYARRLWHIWPTAAQAIVENSPALFDSFIPPAPVIARAATYLSGIPPWLPPLEKQMARSSQEATAHGSSQSFIFEGVTAALAALAAQQPLLLLLDDLHWIDPSSAGLLFHLARRMDTSRILIIGAYRPEDVAVGRRKGDERQPHPLAGLLPEFKRIQGDLRVSLSRQTQQQARHFVDALLDAEPNRLGQAFRRAFQRQTEGHPLFAVELLRDMRARGDLRQDGAGRWVVSPSLSWRATPSKVAGVIEHRLSRLDATQRTILSIAAVEGETFSAQTIANVQGIEVRPLLSLLSQEIEKEHRLIQERGGTHALQRYSFVHAYFQNHLYAKLGAGERRLLHREVGAALELLHGAGCEEIAVELAHHFGQAEVWPKAFRYLRLAGDRARHVHASQEALEFYSRALALRQCMTPAPQPAALLPVFEGRAKTYMLLTRYDEAIADFEEMYAQAHACGNRKKEGESLSQLAYVHWLTFSGKNTPKVEAYAQKALALAQETGDERILALSLIRLGSVDQVRGNLLEADRKFTQALQISERRGYRNPQAQAQDYLCMQAYLQGNYQRSIRFGHKAWAEFQEIHDGFNELHALAFLCQALWGAGEYAEALRLTEEGLRKAQERKNDFFVGRILNTFGWYYREFGDVARAAQYDQESLEMGRRLGIANVEISALVNLGLDFVALGQPEKAQRHLESILERVQRDAYGAHKWRWQMKLLLGLAEVHLSRAEQEQALQFASAGLAQAQATNSSKYVVQGRALEGKILLALRQPQNAIAALQEAYDLAQKIDSPTLIYPTAFALGRQMERSGRQREAQALYTNAQSNVQAMADAIAAAPRGKILASTLLHSSTAQAIQAAAATIALPEPTGPARCVDCGKAAAR